MHLNKIKIENFRSIESHEVELDQDVTVFIGENNSGKTSVLEALRFGLITIKSGKICNFSGYDFYRNEECDNLSLDYRLFLNQTFKFFDTLNKQNQGDDIYPDYNQDKYHWDLIFNGICREHGDNKSLHMFLQTLDSIPKSKSFLKDFISLQTEHTVSSKKSLFELGASISWTKQPSRFLKKMGLISD